MSDLDEEKMMSLSRFLPCGVCGGSGALYLRMFDGSHVPIGWCGGCKGTGYVKPQDKEQHGNP